MPTHRWKVVPLCGDQLRDVRPEDVLYHDGLPTFRLCHTYRGGGGYDQFPAIAESRGLVDRALDASVQFVVQLYGCNLDCPFCYVTRRGVWDTPIKVGTQDLVLSYVLSGANVFHLMGGAPALQMQYWPELLDALGPSLLFHSDLMLTEKFYDREILRQLDRDNVLLAVSIKGITPWTFQRNTRKKLPVPMMDSNLDRLREFNPKRWYFTFTNVPEDERDELLEQWPDAEWFDIDLIDYAAVPYVDNRTWGRSGR